MVVVIPAYAEADTLPASLESLAANKKEMLDATAVLVVVNNPPLAACPPEKLADNIRMIARLAGSPALGGGKLNLFWADASSDGYEIDPAEGVGAARKIGMDTALPMLNWQADPLILSLDADTLVEPDYLEAVANFFAGDAEAAGAWIRFEHQPGATAEEDDAIAAYELFIRLYVECLRLAGSPYAYHTLGSAFAVRARDYVRAGGMRRKNGGEDFYFLQALRKIGSIGGVVATCVRPSSRPSDRVPFGTGPRIAAFLASGAAEMRVYNPLIFDLLKRVYAAVDNGGLDGTGDAASLRLWLDALPPLAVSWLESQGFVEQWPSIVRNTPCSSVKRRWAFHTWFDAFKTLKFVHFCEAGMPEKYHKIGVTEAAGLCDDIFGCRLADACPHGVKGVLHCLREAEVRRSMIGSSANA